MCWLIFEEEDNVSKTVVSGALRKCSESVSGYAGLVLFRNLLNGLHVDHLSYIYSVRHNDP
jgi:hypothetical protein